MIGFNKKQSQDTLDLTKLKNEICNDLKDVQNQLKGSIENKKITNSNFKLQQELSKFINLNEQLNSINDILNIITLFTDDENKVNIQVGV